MTAWSAAEAEAVRLFPVLRRLVDLREPGWRFLHGPALDGVPVCIDGFRQWAGGGRPAGADGDGRTGHPHQADSAD